MLRIMEGYTIKEPKVSPYHGESLSVIAAARFVYRGRDVVEVLVFLFRGSIRGNLLEIQMFLESIGDIVLDSINWIVWSFLRTVNMLHNISALRSI